MKKTVKKERNQLPVSRKFYDGIIGRIGESLASLSGGSKACADSVRALVDGYMADGKMPGPEICDIERLAFMLLRPEIDKAMARSAAARRRSRRVDSTEKAPEASEASGETSMSLTRRTLPEPFDENVGDDEMAEQPEPVVALNRRERRLREREARRQAKRKQKRAA